MLTRESLYVILYSIPVYQLLFYTVQLITFKRTSPSRRYLGLLLFLMTVFLVINAVYHLGYESEMRWLYLIFVPTLLSIAPVFYFYIVSMSRENHEVDSRTRFILFLPPIVIFMLNLIVYRGLTGPEKLAFLQNGFLNPGIEGMALNNAIFIHWLGMAGLLFIQLILSLAGGYKILHKEAEIMHDKPQHLAYLKLGWIMVISICVMVFLVSGSVFNLFGPARGLSTALIYNILMLICGGLTGYFGMKQDTLLVQVSKMKSGVPLIVNAEVSQDAVSGQDRQASDSSALLEENEVQAIIQGLEEIMRRDKPYLNPKFSMHDLCEQLNVSRRKVTYVINEVMDKNFYGVINDYRIEEAIELLKDDRTLDYKMDAIAEMVGFQSKSSFYACFKKYTGVTPTEYRNNMS